MIGKRCRGEAAFALIDVTVALVILAVGILAGSLVMNGVVQNMRASYEATRMAALAQAEMERVLSIGYEHRTPSELDLGTYRISWQVRRTYPVEVRLIVRQGAPVNGRADTLVALIPPR